ncbi:MAG: hypothetical protein ACRDFQ_05230 [Anaerolineales bacterium]
MKRNIRILISLLTAVSFLLAACSPFAPETNAAPEQPAAESESGEPEEQPAAGGVITFETSDACAILSEGQVSAAFGKAIVGVTPDEQAIGTGCEYDFGSDTELQVSIYEGNAGKHYFAGLIQAAEESCDALLERFFDIAFGQNPDSGQDVSGLSMADLYNDYVAALGECMYVASAVRPDVGENVLATETIFLNWSSNVAVLGDDRVVEITYQEPIPADAQNAFQGATDKDSFYALAQPYRDSVLAGYTEILIGLLQVALTQ